MFVGFLNSFLNINLLFSPLQVGFVSWTVLGRPKRWLTKVDLVKLKKNINKATIYRVMNIKCGTYFYTTGKYEYKVYS